MFSIISSVVNCFQICIFVLGNTTGITSRRGAKKEPNYSTMCYWDTKKQAFRSFRVENFIAGDALMCPSAMVK